MDELFVIANNFLALLPLFSTEGFSMFRPFPFVKAIKAWSAGEPVLITLVSKGAVAAGALVSRSPTSYTQSLFLKT